MEMQSLFCGVLFLFLNLLAHIWFNNPHLTCKANVKATVVLSRGKTGSLMSAITSQ